MTVSVSQQQMQGTLDEAALKKKVDDETSYTQIKQEIVQDFGRYPIYPDSEAVADNADLTDMGI